MHNKDGERSNPWVYVHTVQDYPTKLIVRVAENTAAKQPTYALELGQIFTVRRGQPSEETFTSRRVMVRYQQPAFNRVEVGDSYGTTIARLIRDAELWVEMMLQSRCDEIVEARRVRDELRASFGKKDVRTTGKTDKTRNKGRDNG